MKPSDTLLDKLAEYSSSGAISMHMPGHKRNIRLADYLKQLGARYDITEIDGFDNLHGAEGILAEAMERAAALFGSRASFFLVNGSTCGILAGIRAATRYGDRILAARNCHKSIYHAMELCNLDPVFLVPPIDESFGVYASISPEQVEQALEQHHDIRLIVLTSPSFEGVISDIGAICALAHRRGIPVLVDEAHGAHLDHSDEFRGGAVAAGADLVIQSLHKTLPSLTQTAIAHHNSDLVSCREFARQLSIFESSSPSYLLMASIDSCVNLLQTRGEELFRLWQGARERFHERVRGLTRLRVLCYGRDSREQHPLMFGFDRSKLVISTRGTDLSGTELMECLRRQYHIELEMAAGDYAIAMTGLGTQKEHLDALADALLALDAACAAVSGSVQMPNVPPIPARACGVARALEQAAECIPLRQTPGRVSGEYIWAYPPGIPLMIPGERIDEGFVAAILELERRGVHLKSTAGKLPFSLEVLRGE